jgi:hypothetical protein
MYYDIIYTITERGRFRVIFLLKGRVSHTTFIQLVEDKETDNVNSLMMSI